ncbi:hypothetical protein GCM10010371_66000 [Streptomyces subrutilus]|uniref:Uncharacterized protein n=1 Tax=Streptomyces subrutilus TaxID=36818 RepID=A0A918REI4_9ACTN|nr:hypothetical protein [Streptomyces subrutilus]GGZ96875.1 hypothetical protein GCM10010371_66000 [Streptomyces subrutilus]
MLAKLRATTGRAASVAGAVVLTGGLGADSLTLPGTLAIAATAAVGVAANVKLWRAPENVRATAIAVYVAPHAGCAALLVGERLAPDTPLSLLVQAAAAALWTGAAWWLRPGIVARDLVDAALAEGLLGAAEAETGDEDQAPALPVYASAQARWWGETAAVEGGIAPGTVLLDHQQVTDDCLALVIGAAEHGRAVGKIPVDGLSALLDLPEELIEIGPVPGRGAGVRLVVLGRRPQPAEETADDAQVWAQIAATAMPGVELIDVTTYPMRKELT